MDDTTSKVETVTPEALKNEVTPVAAPQANAVDPAEVERLKKAQEQKDLRIRQLENEAAARAKADEDRKTKDLEDQQQYKTLLEQERAAKQELLVEREAREKREAVDKTAAEVLKDYTDEVRDLAKDLGVSLSDDSEDAVADFKAKLDSAAKRVGITKVTPNNPAAPPSAGKASGEELRIILNDPVKRDAYMREHYPTTAAMMTPRSTT